MRLAELSARSGLSTATIKYYLRAGLLPAGVTRSATWASYDESHVRRLRLVRALTDVAGLSLEEVRGVVEAVDASGSDHQARGAAQWPLSPAPAREPSTTSVERVEALLSRHGWELASESPHRRTLAAALDTLDELDFAATDEILDAYARGLESVAEIEVARVAAETEPVVAAERLVVGTLLYEPVLLTLRRMAHEAVSARP
ncbi:MAG TPA: MerR family transcriptional regulator [Nocardioidaceae bacterium]|nr:MerR family transcriptional regulator [Nocardioidaceae bacterium]